MDVYNASAGESSMQAPACAHCIRRDETCEYAGVIDESSAMVYRSTFGSLSHLPSVHPGHAARAIPCSSSNYSFPDKVISNTSSIGLMLQTIMGRSWFTPAEAGIWSKTILNHVHEHPYLQHCVYSVAYLRRDLLDRRANGCTSAVAYEHQVAASALFRQRTTPIQHDTWLPTLSFHVFMLVFEFGSQSACADSQYNLLDTLRVLRSSHAIEEAAKPYFRASKLWQMISNRDRARSYEVDSALKTNLLALGGVVAELTSSNAGDAALNSQALTALKQWVSMCDAHPRRWDQYCYWPGQLDGMFLQLLDGGDDVALLLIIHWSAILYRSPKPSVYYWAKRTAGFAIGQLREKQKWENLLIWPLQTLCEVKDFELSILNMSEHAKMLEVDKQLRALGVIDTVDHGFEDTFRDSMTLESPPFFDTALSSSSGSVGSPDHPFTGHDFSIHESTWTTEDFNTTCVAPYTSSLTELEMLNDPMVLQMDELNDVYSTDWHQYPIPHIDIDSNGCSEGSGFV